MVQTDPEYITYGINDADVDDEVSFTINGEHKRGRIVGVEEDSDHLAEVLFLSEDENDYTIFAMDVSESENTDNNDVRQSSVSDVRAPTDYEVMALCHTSREEIQERNVDAFHNWDNVTQSAPPLTIKELAGSGEGKEIEEITDEIYEQIETFERIQREAETLKRRNAELLNNEITLLDYIQTFDELAMENGGQMALDAAR